MNVALSINNHLNQKVITAIINLDGSTLKDNLITSQKALIPAGAVENYQENMASKAFCSNKVDSIMSSF